MQESDFCFESQIMALPLSFSVQLVVIALFTFTLPCVTSQGLTRDACVTDQDCVSPRTCRFGICSPPTPVGCLSDDACPEGETCVVLSAIGAPTGPFCASIQAVRGTSAQPVTQPNPSGGGLTGELCFRNDDCRSPRACVFPIRELCVGKFGCFCAPPVLQACENDGDCPQGEVCGFLGEHACGVDEASRTPIKSVSTPTAVVDPVFVEDSIENGRGPNSSSGTVVGNGEVCVAERHLKGVRGTYESGRLAHVLCDSRGSCATPGHLVVFHGKGMMMQSYCDVVGCTERIMKVNSPKWERQLRVKSWSHGLEFTAFAARYETLAEEMVLAGMAKAGL